MKKAFLTLAAALLCALCLAAPKSYVLSSPDGRLKATVEAGSALTYSVEAAGEVVLAPSEISLTLKGGVVYGGAAKVQKCTRRSVDQMLSPVVYKKAEVRDCFNEMTLTFKDFQLVFRAYDEGVAYRFVSRSKVDFAVEAEKASFSFPADWQAYVPYVRKNTKTLEEQFFNSFENVYTHCALSAWDTAHLAFLPLVVEASNGRKVLITESDLLDYPGMYLYNGDGDSSLEGVWAPVPDKVDQGGHNMLQGLVKTRKDYIAECKAGASMPWRIVAVADKAAQLADCDMVWKLATPSQEGADWSWIEPGKVAWDWWNDWNIRGVDFESGVNNDTYKYYIDFASRNGIEYVILDEGWAVNKKADLFQVVPEIDLQMLCDYAAERNVGIVLWAGYWAFNRDIEGICRHFAEMGVKGFKIDFMDRDDQQVVRFYRDAAAAAAKYHLFCDFHGAFKPAGLTRTYPNVLNFEGVHGLEQMKWEKVTDQVEYDVTIPFIRMAAGPMDYTQGAMRNATIRNYFPCNSEPMSIGTRCRQLAEYVIFDAPFTMLCDSPSNYIAEPECTDFIASIPTVWDETLALDGEIADYVVMARRSGSTWYVGALTDESARDITIDASFLPEGEYDVVIFRDGANAHKAASDYAVARQTISNPKSIEAHLAPAGGWVACITRK